MLLPHFTSTPLGPAPNVNDLDKLVERLQGYYETSSSLREAWAYESPILGEILAELSRVLEGRYLLEDVLGVGGSGVVLRAFDLSLEAPRAVKFSRPSPGKQAMLARFLSAETESLMSLAHPNLMRIFARGKAVVGTETFPFYVMEMFEGVEDYDDFVARKTTSGTQVFSLTEGVLDAIAYMHAAGRVHMDLKPGNILVTPQGRPIISDLGFTKVLRSEEGLTLIGGTEGYMHPEARAAIDAASSDPNRIRGEIEIAALKPAWDLYALGKTLFVILRAIEEREDAPLTRYEYRYLKLMACRLLDGHNQSSEAILGLTTSTMGELRYTSTEEALQDLRKMTGGYSIETAIPELNPYVAETIQASTFATTPFTIRVKRVVEHPLVLRLGGFTQLSLLNLVYPTATHTRLEHVIGCFSAMIRYLNALYHDPSAK
jgi:serine/threonine protein kinase